MVLGIYWKDKIRYNYTLLNYTVPRCLHAAYTLQLTLYSLQFAVYSWQFILYSTVYSL